MVEDRPLGSWNSLFKGVLGGSLIGSGLFSFDLGAGFQAIMFVIGLLIIFDSIISKTGEIYPMTMFLGALAGFFIALFSVIGQVNLYYTILIIILAGIVYLGKLVMKQKRR